MTSSFVAPRWLAGRHAQTVFAALVRLPFKLPLTRERWELPDGDFLDLRDDLYAGSIFKDGSRVGNGGGVDFNDAGPQHKSRKDDDPEPVDIGKIEAALEAIDSNCSYEVWLKNRRRASPRAWRIRLRPF